MTIGTYDFLTLKQAAEQLNIDESTLRNAINNKELTALKLGQGYQFKKEWLDAWLAGKIVNPDASRAGGEA